MDWKDLIGPVIAQGAPKLGELLGSTLPIPFGGTIGKWAGERLAEALGVEATPQAVEVAIKTKPPEVVQAAVQETEAAAVAKWDALAKISASQVEERKAELADVQDARSTQVQFVKEASWQAWGAPIVSILIVLLFAAVMIIWLFFPPSGNPAALAILNIMVGSLGAAFGQVVNYYLGSSAGSRDKSQEMAALTASLAKPAAISVSQPAATNATVTVEPKQKARKNL